MVFVQIAEFDWLPGGTKKVNFRKKKREIIFSESVRWMKLILFIHA